MQAEQIHLTVDRLWNGRPAPGAGMFDLRIGGLRSPRSDAIELRIDAPFHGDPAPPAAAGRFDTLWEYEVVEVFLANAQGQYLELEFGPHGHFLALRFEGQRNCVDRDVAVRPKFERARGRWQVECAIDRHHIPSRCDRLNAYAIFGAGGGRTHLAYAAYNGSRPDFHAIEAFARLDDLTPNLI